MTTPSDSIYSVARYVTSIMSPVIPGQTKLQEALGGELKTPCYCMERTMTTPSDSIYSVARYVTSIMSPSNSRPDQATGGPGWSAEDTMLLHGENYDNTLRLLYSVARYVTSIMSPSNSRPDQATGGPGWRAEDTMLLHGENYDNTLRLHLQCCQVCNQHYVLPVIPGQTKLLEALGGELKTPCYCMERTMTTPSDSIYSVARYVTSIMSPQ